MDIGKRAKLLAYLGSANVRVAAAIKRSPAKLEAELLRLCREVYGVDADEGSMDCGTIQIADKIDALGKSERRRLCKEFRTKHGIPHPQRNTHRDREPRINEFPASPQRLSLPQNQPNYTPKPAPRPDPAHMQTGVRVSAKKLQKLRRKQEMAEQRSARRATGAPSEAAISEFYVSWEWKRLSYDAKLERGRKCECCGAKAPDVRIHTDHVKPIRHYWHLRFDRSNLQILCEDCNMGKGSRDETDFRSGPEDDLGVPLEEPRVPVIWN